MLITLLVVLVFGFIGFLCDVVFEIEEPIFYYLLGYFACFVAVMLV